MRSRPLPRKRWRPTVISLPGWADALLGGSLVVAVTYVIGLYDKAFRGFPKGYDALGHLAKIHLLLSKLPQVNWNSTWYSGAPYFAGSYPPGYHAVVAELAVLTDISPSQSMVIVAAMSMLMITLGLYGFVRAVTGRSLGALIAVALVLGGPAQWSQILEFGLYPRLLGMGFAAVALAIAASCAKRPTQAKLVIMILALAASASVHLLTAIFGGVLVVVVILLLSKDRYLALLEVGAVGAATLALVGYFYVPYILTPANNSMFTTSLKPIPWRSLFWPSGTDLAAWNPVLVPAVLICAAAAWLLWRRLRASPQVPLEFLGMLRGEHATSVNRTTVKADDSVRRSLLTAATFAAIALLMAAYCVAGHFKHSFNYLAGLDPPTLLTYPEWLLAAACGIVVAAWRNLVPRYTPRSAVPAGLLAACAVSGLALAVPLLPAGATDYQATLTMLQHLVATNIPNQQQFRVVSNDTSSSEPLNIVTTSPQTGGYQQDQALANTDFQHWLTAATTDPSWNPEERLFLLDWYAAGWVFTIPGSGYAAPYQSHPGKFRELASSPYGPVSLFKVNQPSPIVSVSNAPTVLFIGDPSHYDTFLRALSDSDIDSSRLVPAYGGTDVDGIGAAEIANYSTVFLYGALSRDPAKANDLLSGYVGQGGRLVIDAGDQGPSSPVQFSPGSVLPVTGDHTTVVSGSWAFTAGKGMIDRASLGSFSPPSYALTGSWQVEKATGLQPGAQALLRSGGSTVLLADRDLGAGVVYWSGLNLPYHDAAFENAAESGLLGALVGAAQTSVPSPAAAPSVSPEHIRVTAAGRGLLVKENWTPDWRATVNGHAIPVETAGPGMMYIGLPRNGAAVVVLSYHLSDIELFGIAVSLAAVLGLIVALLLRRRLRRALAYLRAAHPQRMGNGQWQTAIRTALTAPDPVQRTAAVRLLDNEKLAPYADVLLNLARRETDPGVLDALTDAAMLHQWEPVRNAPMVAFLQWASERSRSGDPHRLGSRG